jgi:flagellar M-ring protein FliF
VAPTLDPRAVFTQLFEKFLKLPLAHKVLVPVLVVFPAWALIYVSKMATQPDYTVLYSDLSPADAGAVVERLKEMKAAYKVEGSTVSVSPPDLVHELRISLAAEGVPKTGTVGFELFDGTSFATTSMGEMVKKQRALQGELERTIMSLDAVLSARVHISQPEKTIFAKQAQDPSASVLLKLRAGGDLDKKQIRGIANFVANGVEGLKPEDVTIIDVYGNLLTPTEEGDELGADATRLTYTKEVEKSYTQRIESMLAKVLGPGKVVARVTADLDFSSNEREEESYDPGGQVIRSERSVEEGAAGAARGGVPGVAANLSNDPNLLSPPANADSNTRREAVKNFEVSRAIIKSSQAKGKLLRLSAAVLVDGKYEDAPLTSTGGVVTDAVAAVAPSKVFKSLSPETLAQVEGVVKSAIGFDATRGDVVTVENIPFFQPDENLKDELAKAAEINAWYRYMALSVPLLALLIFGVFVLRPMMKFLTSNPEAEIDITRLLPQGMQVTVPGSQQVGSNVGGTAGTAGVSGGVAPEVGAATPVEAAAGAQAAAAKGIPDLSGPVDMEQLGEIMAESSRLVKDNPAQAALLIRYWLNEGHL